jgi:hypothetical protein
VFESLQDDHPSAIPLLKMEKQDLPLPELSPFFYKQSSSSRHRQHHEDLFDCYPELLAEIINRLVDQLKKVFASRSDVANADRSSSLIGMGEISM